MGNRIYDKLADTDLLAKSPILVFAADPLASAGIKGLGQVQKPKPHYRTHAEFLQLQRDLTADGLLDGLLMTPADAEILALDENLFENSPITPIVRMNSETAIWNPRFGVYTSRPSMPFQTVFPEDMQRYCENLIGPALDCRVNLGLYSITLNNDPIVDERMLQSYVQFAHVVGEIEGFDHLLEVFLPNVKMPGMDEEKRGMYVADSIVRTMSYLRKHQRPRFIKTAYTTSDVWKELCEFDTTLVIGALGGPRQNARSTFALAHNVVSNGGRAILFGRTIFGEDNPISFVQCLRRVLDSEYDPQTAHAEYQKNLRTQS